MSEAMLLFGKWCQETIYDQRSSTQPSSNQCQIKKVTKNLNSRFALNSIKSHEKKMHETPLNGLNLLDKSNLEHYDHFHLHLKSQSLLLILQSILKEIP